MVCAEKKATWPDSPKPYACDGCKEKVVCEFCYGRVVDEPDWAELIRVGWDDLPGSLEEMQRTPQSEWGIAYCKECGMVGHECCFELGNYVCRCHLFPRL